MRDAQKSELWNNIIRAAEGDPRPEKAIRGASGFSHPVIAVGVDEKRRRVVMISGESDARYAALAQGDIQAAMPSVKVAMARPLALNLGVVAKLISEVLGKFSVGPKDAKWMSDHKKEFQKRSQDIIDSEKITNIVASPFSALGLNLLAVFKEAMQQLFLIEIQKSDNLTKTPTINVQRLAVLDPVEADRRMGVCSIPLYDIDKESMEILSSKSNVDLAKEILRKHDILQYFFPAADHLALGLVDNGVNSPSVLLEQLRKTPREGHPYGPLEILKQPASLLEVVDALKDRGLLTEVELGYEVSPNGNSYRAQVCSKPREGLVSKLSKIFSIKIDLSLKDLFKGIGQ
jgi:hypothetical protein